MSEAPLALLDGVDGPALALVAVVAFGGAIVSGMSGFGGGLILPPVLAPIVGVEAVVPILSVSGLIVNANRFWIYRRAVDRRLTVAALAAIVPGVAVGASVYVNLSATAIGVLLGAFLILAVPAGRWLAARKLRLNAVGLGLGGGAYGVVSGATAGVGVLIVPFLLGAGLIGPAFLATDSAISIGINVIKTALFGGYRVLTPGLLLGGLLIGLCMIPGNYVARAILRRTSFTLHRLLLEALVIAGGASLLWRSWAGLGG
jgi:uncharacterized membrane protein YfcA